MKKIFGLVVMGLIALTITLMAYGQPPEDANRARSAIVVGSSRVAQEVQGLSLDTLTSGPDSTAVGYRTAVFTRNWPINRWVAEWWLDSIKVTTNLALVTLKISYLDQANGSWSSYYSLDSVAAFNSWNNTATMTHRYFNVSGHASFPTLKPYAIKGMFVAAGTADSTAAHLRWWAY